MGREIKTEKGGKRRDGSGEGSRETECKGEGHAVTQLF